MALTAEPLGPSFGIADRLRKTRQWAQIKSTELMAEYLNAHFGDRLRKPIAASTVASWENGTNVPSKRTIPLEELVPAWVEICNQHAPTGSGEATPAFVWGYDTRTGRFAHAHLALVDGDMSGQMTWLDDDLHPVPVGQAQLQPV